MAAIRKAQDREQSHQEWLDWLDREPDPLEAQFREERLQKEAAEYARRSQTSVSAAPTPTPAPARAQTTASRAPEGGALVPTPLARTFMLAGNAIFTVVSKKTGARFTFKLTRPKPEPGKDAAHQFYHGRPRRQPVFVAVLSGPANTDDYTYLGQMWEDGEKLTYAIGKKSRVTADAPSQKAALWVTKLLNKPELMEQCDIYHAGRCGRCGRMLTVPESIQTGLGPECAGRL